MSRSRTVASVGLLALVATVIANRALAANVDDAIAIFDKLGLPSVKDRRFARFNTGGHWKDGKGKLEFHYIVGWVLSEDANEVELLTPGLVARRLKRDRTPPEDWAKHRDAHPTDMPLPGELVTVDFEKLAQELATGSVDPPDSFEAMYRAAEGGLPRYAEACLFASWAKERGKADLATQLGEFAPRAFTAHGKARRRDDAPTTIEAAVAHDVAENRRWQAIERANEGAPRKELLERWKLIAEVLPRTSWTDEAKTAVESYSSLLEEDAKWTEPTAAELEKLAPADRVTHWIHMLRDLPARQMSQPGSVSPFGWQSGLSPDAVNPAVELVKLRWDAIPAVIEHLTDGRPTRSMGYGRDYMLGSFYLLTIGDCCAVVFQETTGEEIYRRTSTAGAMTKDGRARAAQKLAREWWDKVKDKGERVYLVEAVSSGDPERIGVAGLLVTRYPDAALAAMKEGLAHIKDDRWRTWLIAVASELKSDDAIELLESEAAPGRSLRGRIAASEGLLRRGKKAALAPMMREWEELPGDARELSESLTKLLVAAGEPEAIRVLAKDLSRRSLAVKRSVIDDVGHAAHGFTNWKPPAGDKAADAERRAAWEVAAQDLLAASLEDEEESTGSSAMRGTQSWRDPRICDLAADELFMHWRERYTFDIAAPLADRDRSLWAMRDAYRRSRGLAPLASGWPAVPPEDRARLDAALDAFCKEDAGARSKASGELELIGVSGLAAIETRIATLGSSPAAKELDALARRVSCTVVASVATTSLGEVPEALRARLAAAREKPLTGPGFVELVTTAATCLPADARSLEVTAERASDGSGVFVRVAFGREPGPRGGGSTPVENATRVVLGKEAIATLTGGGTPESVRTPEVHEAARSALERCLASPARTPFFARVALSFFGEPAPEKPAGEAPPAGTVKLDSRGDPLPAHARARYGSLRWKHADSVQCVAWTPDGESIVSGGRDHTVRIWDTATGRERRRLAAGTWLVFDVAVSPDGKFVAAGCGDKSMRVWDLASGATRLAVPHPEQVAGVAFSPDGKLLATGCTDGSVRVFRAESGDCLRQVQAAKKDGESHAYFSLVLRWLDGETLAIAGIDDKVRFLRGDELSESASLGRSIVHIACSPDGKRIAASGRKDRRLVVYDVKARTIRTHESGGGDSDGSWPVAFSPDGKVIAGGDPAYCCIRRWKAETGEALETLERIHDGIADLAFSPDGKRVAGGADHELHVWDAASGKLLSGPSGAGELLALALSPDGKTLVTGDRGSRLIFLDPASLAPRREVAASAGLTLAFSPDGKHLLGAIGGSASVWNGTTGELEQEHALKPHAYSVAFSPDGDTFAAGDRDGAHIFSLSGGKELRKIAGECSALSFSTDGKLLAKGRGMSFGAAVFEVATGEERFGLEDPSSICASAFSPDGKTLATGSRGPNGNRAALWDIATGKLIRAMEAPNMVRCMAYSPDGTLLAIGCQGVGTSGAKELGIWQVSRGERLIDLQGHAAMVTGVAFSKDGKALYSSSMDGTVLAWDVPEKSR